MYADTHTGLFVLWDHLVTLSAAVLLLALHIALGSALRDRLAPSLTAGPAWRLPVDAALGAGVLATLLFPLGLAGLLTGAGVLVVTALAAIVVRRRIGELARDLRALRVPSVPRALVAALLLVLLAGALAPPTEWDSLMYHLRIPLWLLEGGKWAVPPDSFHIALVGLSHLSTLPLLAFGFREGPAVMQVFAFALLIAATFELAARAGATRSSRWIAVAVLLGCPAFALVAITARVDVSLVLMLVAAHLVLIESSDRAEATGMMLLAALLIGFAVAIKPQAGAYAIALIPLGWRAARGVKPAAIAAAIAIAVAAPWILKNQLLVGAPLYPKGAPGWFEPWLAELFGGRVRPAGFDDSILRALPEARGSFNLLAAFLDPGSLTIEGEGAFYGLSPALFLLPVLLLAARAKPRALGLLGVGIAYSALVVVPFGQINLRYLMPAVPALAAALAATAEWTGERISTEMRRVVLAAIAIGALLPLTGAIRQRFLDPNVVLLRHAVGLASAQEVWRRHPDGTARSFAPVVANVQRLVPANGKVLLLWEARALPLEREAIADVMLSNWSFLAQSGSPAKCLAGTGITHLVVGGGSVDYYAGRGADVKAFHLQDFARFREQCLTGHRSIGPGFEYFEVRPATP